MRSSAANLRDIRQKRLRWISELPGVVVSLATLLRYLTLAPAHVLGGDNGEFVALASASGLAHPPGYPLYVLYLRALNWLPGEGALPASLATALLGALQVALLYVACRVWRMPPAASAIATAFFAASALASQLNSHAEVFALHGVLVAALLAIAPPWLPLPPLVRLAGCGALLGLGLSHHHSIVLLTPLFLFTLASAVRASPPASRLRNGAIAASTLLVATLPNLLLILWSDPSPAMSASWGGVDNLAGLLHHMLRRDYGTFTLAEGGRTVDLASQFRLLGQSLYWTWTLLLPLTALGFLHPFWARRSGRAERWLWLALWLAALCSGPIFVSRFNMSSIPPGPAVFERFHLLPALLLTLPTANGLRLAGDALKRASCTGSGLAGCAAAGLGAALSLFAFWFSAMLAQARVQERSAADVDLFLRNSLMPLPRGSVLLVLGDHKLYGYAYLQSVERHRSDVLILAPSLWKYSWYRRRSPIAADGSHRDLRPLVASAQAQGRSVYIDQGLLPFFSGYPSVQQGVYRRLLASGEPLPSAERQLADQQHIFSRFRLPDPKPLASDGWGILAAVDYLRSWQALAIDLDRLGRRDLAATARRLALGFGPCVSRPCLDPLLPPQPVRGNRSDAATR
ncbi:MAG: hypothetical protein RLZZ219_477 [Cyanobacteriota bacterium]